MRFGDYVVRCHKPGRLVLLRAGAIVRHLGFVALAMAGVCVALIGMASDSRAITLLPFCLLLTLGSLLVWYLRRHKVFIDGRAGTLRIRQGTSDTVGSTSDYYAVFLDTTTGNAPELQVVLAERFATSPMGGTVIAACRATDPAARFLPDLAAAVGAQFQIPVKTTADLRRAKPVAFARLRQIRRAAEDERASALA